MGDKKSDQTTLFASYSYGVKTNRDAWCYNASFKELKIKIDAMIIFFESEKKRYDASGRNVPEKDFIDSDATKISWSSRIIPMIGKEKSLDESGAKILLSTYRPFEKLHFYYSANFNDRRGKMPSIFPNRDLQNCVIALNGIGSGSQFCGLLLDTIPNNHTIDSNQCFPLHLYEPTTDKDDLFTDKDAPDGYTRRDGITDAGLAHFRDAYPGEDIGKEDLFYYVYGLLHSPDYRERYADTLTKQLPRIPRVKSAKDFWAFSKAGRALGDLHVNYESVDPYKVGYKDGALLLDTFTDDDFRVEKMKFAGKRGAQDKTTVIYNGKITMTGIPLDAYAYVVNGKPALEWVMERQSIKTDKASGIVNDANRYATETVGDARYPLMLFQRVITVSLETMKIVRGLPRLDFNTLS